MKFTQRVTSTLTAVGTAIFAQTVVQSIAPKIFMAIVPAFVMAVAQNANASTVKPSATIVQQRINATNRLLPLQKLTVGPHDQYDGSIDHSGRYLVFTRKSDLVASLQSLNIETGEVVDLLPSSADSQEARVSAKGQLAFISFRNNARGDVCWVSEKQDLAHVLPNESIRCLPRAANRSATQRSNPFWKSENEIGFLEKDLVQQISRIVIQNVDGKLDSEIVGGTIWSPSMSADGRYLVYNESNQGPSGANEQTTVNASKKNVAMVEPSRATIIYDFKTKKKTQVSFALPGITGFSTISPDGRFIYFSHYLNDTNNDRSIDGEDSSVVFRIETSRALSAGNESVLPQQLTSADTSCSFPHPASVNGDEVYITCAFEGSLDVYRVPGTGVVPESWNESRVENALATSRSFQERILLLNSLKRLSPEKNNQIDDRLFSNHLYSDDTVAAKFYLHRLQSVLSEPNANLLAIYLATRELKKAQPEGGVSREFRNRLALFDGQIDSIIAKHASLRFLGLVLKGFNRHFVGDSKAAEQFFSQTWTLVKANRTPLERYLWFTLGEQLQRAQKNISVDQYLRLYHEMMRANELSDETKIYYAFLFLQKMRQVEPVVKTRLKWLEDAVISTPRTRTLAKSVETLLRAESLVLKIIVQADDREKQLTYLGLDRLMSETRDNYFLRKALYIRAILSFSESADFKYLSMVASNWLRYTQKDDTEFSYAREVVATAALDRAYDSLDKKNLDFAGNFFYESLSLTDDLESHYGYIQIMLDKNQRSTIDDRYKNLKQRQFIADNSKYVDALLVLADQKANLNLDPKLVKPLDRALELVESMSQDRDSAVRYLFLGWLGLEKLLRTGNGIEFDLGLFQRAHRNLMLAYDLGRENARVKASALVNLGLLHERVGNHGLASKYFSLRKNMGYMSNDEKLQIQSLYAQSLARSQQFGKAVDEITEVVSGRALVIDERHALYLLQAGKYQSAADLYKKVLSAGSASSVTKGSTGNDMGDGLSIENRAKLNFAYGYCLFKMRSELEARAAFEEAIANTQKYSSPGAKNMSEFGFKPDRLLAMSYGYLGQLSILSKEQRLQMNQGRRELLEKNKSDFQDVDARLIQLNWQWIADKQAAESHGERGGSSEILEHFKMVQKQTAVYVKKNQAINQTVFRSLVNSMEYALLHRELGPALPLDEIGKLVDRSLLEYTQLKVQQPILDFQELKLRILWAAFSAQLMGQQVSENQSIESLLESGQMQNLKAELPKQWKELSQIAQALLVK